MAHKDSYSLGDIAQKLGHAPRWIYRNERWRKLIDEDGMPAPMSKTGHPRFNKRAIDAWLGRDHPHAPKVRAANDTAPLAAPQNDAAHRDYLHRVYGRRSA